MKSKNKSLKANIPRNFFLVVILFFIFRYIKALWEYSFDVELMRYYKMENFEYILIALIVIANILALWGIFKYKLWWFKAFLVAIVFQLLETTIVILCLVCDKSVFKIVYGKNILAHRLDLDFLEKFFTLKYLLLYLIFFFFLGTVLLLLAYKNQKRIVEK